MNFLQLDRYIEDLTQSGFEGTVKLQVRLYRKFSVPLFALMMAMIAIPFGFLVGNRGAMAGVGLSIGIAIGYLGIGQLFEKLGARRSARPGDGRLGPRRGLRPGRILLCCSACEASGGSLRAKGDRKIARRHAARCRRSSATAA